MLPGFMNVFYPRWCDSINEEESLCLSAGLFTLNQQVSLDDIILPDSGRTCTIDHQSAHVFSSECRYDLILGHNFFLKNWNEFDFEAIGLQLYVPCNHHHWWAESVQHIFMKCFLSKNLIATMKTTMKMMIRLQVPPS
jgi:hypothetical protein